MEGQTPSGPSSEKAYIPIALATVALVATLIIAAIPLAIIPEEDAIPVAPIRGAVGYREGTYFIYDATGTYNGTSTGGSYNLSMVAFPGGGYGYYRSLNSTIPELNDMMNEEHDYSLNLDLTMMGGVAIGIGNFSTAYGPKVVMEEFQPHVGWVAIYYIGSNPEVAYGCTAIGPNFRLDLRLSSTNDQLAIENNSSPVRLAPEPTPGLGYDGFYADGKNTPEFDLYSPNGAPLSYNLTATDVDMYAWSETDILSMIDGSSYVYNQTLTRSHLGNETGRMELPPGFFIIILIGHQAEGTTASCYCYLEGVIATLPPYDPKIRDDQLPEYHPSYNLVSATVEAHENQTITLPFWAFIKKEGNMHLFVSIGGANYVGVHNTPRITMTIDGNSYLIFYGTEKDMGGAGPIIGYMSAGWHSGNLTMTVHDAGIYTVSANLSAY